MHVALLILGIVAALVADDVCGHRAWPRWPLLIAVIGLIWLSGWLYSAPLAAFTLGLGIGATTVAVRGWVRSLRRPPIGR